MELLAGYIVIIEIAKRLKDENTNGRLLSLFDIQLAALNFGIKHHTFINAAKECDDEIKSKLKECGKELQKIAHAGRERTADAARKKLQSCNADIAKFGNDLLKESCRRTSFKTFRIDTSLCEASTPRIPPSRTRGMSLKKSTTLRSPLAAPAT